MKLSVVIPCLNEEDTIGICVRKAIKAFKKINIKGEVVVCDNGSTDGSSSVAIKAGARIVHEEKKGYGNALMKGFSEAKGEYLLMGDADDTYDFSEIPKFLKALDDGYDIVIGSRLKGNIAKGAMPWLHRYVGNPLLTGFLNLLYHTKISDAHCGMRAVTRKAYHRLELKTTGMEFASEMIIKAATYKMKIKEVPINYFARRGCSKLDTFHDGWRHLRFMLLYSPFHLFLIPGIVAFMLGLFIEFLFINGPIELFGIPFITHPTLIGSLLMIMGYQTALLGIYTKVYRKTQKLGVEDKTANVIMNYMTLEKGLLFGILTILTGFGINLYLLIYWITQPTKDFPGVNLGIYALTLTVIGFQTIFSSFFLSILGVEKK